MFFVWIFMPIHFFQVAKRVVAKSRRILLRSPVKSPLKQKATKTRAKWTENEETALVRFVALHGDMIKGDFENSWWPATKDINYWNEAATFVGKSSQSGITRTGNAV